MKSLVKDECKFRTDKSPLIKSVCVIKKLNSWNNRVKNSIYAKSTIWTRTIQLCLSPFLSRGSIEVPAGFLDSARIRDSIATVERFDRWFEDSKNNGRLITELPAISLRKFTRQTCSIDRCRCIWRLELDQRSDSHDLPRSTISDH